MLACNTGVSVRTRLLILSWGLLEEIFEDFYWFIQIVSSHSWYWRRENIPRVCGGPRRLSLNVVMKVEIGRIWFLGFGPKCCILFGSCSPWCRFYCHPETYPQNQAEWCLNNCLEIRWFTNWHKINHLMSYI